MGGPGHSVLVFVESKKESWRINKRSSSHIRKAGSQYTSRCRSCRKPMVRIAKRNWMLDDRRA